MIQHDESAFIKTSFKQKSTNYTHSPIFIEFALISCMEPSTSKTLQIGLLVVDITRSDTGTLNAHLTLLSCGEDIELVIEDCQFNESGLAYAPRLMGAVLGERIRAHLMGILCHGIGFEDRGMEGSLQPGHDGFSQRGRAATDKTEWWGVILGVVSLCTHQQDLMDGGDSSVPRRTMGHHLLPEFRGCKFGGEDDSTT